VTRRSPGPRTAATRRALAAVVALGAVAIGLPQLGATAPAASAAPGARSADAPQCSDGTGTRIPTVPPAFAALQTQLAWGVTKGQGVVVAVVDSGVDVGNPHLAAGALAGGIDLVGDGKGANGFADLEGHGTAVAGQIAARLIDGSGVEGLAPDARILSIRVFATSDDQAVKAGYGPTVDRIAQGIRVAADVHAQVINVSLSTSADAPQLRDAVAYATAHGSLVVASSGNTDSSLSVDKTDDPGPRYPAGDPGALGVSAVDAVGDATMESVHGPHVAISAPGSQILTTARAGIDCVYAGDAPATSFATAYVSACAALVAAAHPEETPAQWAYRLEATAVRPIPGRRDDDLGWGVVQPYDALTLVPGTGIAGPPSPFGDTGSAASAPDQPVRLEQRDPPTAAATTIAVVAGVGAGVVLGTIAVVAILLRRRRDDRSETVPLDDGRPLMGRTGSV